jgi:uncharacterized protein (TIGR00369 family)
MRKSKTMSESICESRKIAMPEEINPHGTLFGGVMMSWIDKIGYMCAQNYAEWKKTVTANIDQIQFMAPVYSGDHVTVKAMVTHVGRSSMEIEVICFNENPINKTKVLVAKANMTFVSVNENGKGREVPKLLLETEHDCQKNLEARIRIDMRNKLQNAIVESRNAIISHATVFENQNFSSVLFNKINNKTKKIKLFIQKNKRFLNNRYKQPC